MSIGECGSGGRLQGYPVVWQYCDPISGNFITFLGQKDVEGIEFTIDELDTTSQDGDGWMTKIPSAIRMAEDVTLDGDLIYTQYLRMVDFFKDQTITKWRRVLVGQPDQPYVEMCGFIKNLSDAYPIQELATMSMTLGLSGRPKWDTVL